MSGSAAGGLLIRAESDRRRKMVSYGLTMLTVVAFTAVHTKRRAFTWSLPESLPLYNVGNKVALLGHPANAQSTVHFLC